jgi:hypothetical protein
MNILRHPDPDPSPDPEMLSLARETTYQLA